MFTGDNNNVDNENNENNEDNEDNENNENNEDARAFNKDNENNENITKINYDNDYEPELTEKDIMDIDFNANKNDFFVNHEYKGLKLKNKEDEIKVLKMLLILLKLLLHYNNVL